MMHLAAIALLPTLWAGGDTLSNAQAAPVTEPAPVEISEWPVPWEDSRPRDPYVGPDGRVWFVGQRADYVAVLDPETGDFERFDLEDGAGPHNLIVDDEGIIWYAGNRAAHIGRLDPATGEIVKYPMPDLAARDPHTLTFDQSGDIWFTVQGGNFVGKLATESGEIELIPVPTEDARPYGIAVDSEGHPWFNELGANKIGTVDPETMELREFTLPREDARTRRIAIASDGGIWYVDYARGYLGRLDPATGDVREWAAPGGTESQPYAMAIDAQDRLWFVETGPEPNRMAGFDPATEEFFSITEIPSGGGTVRHMVFHEPTGTIWFGTDTNTIGRALVPE